MSTERWPAGQQIAVCLNVMYEQWASGSSPGLGPMGNPLAPGTIDYQARSWADYGARTGIWRLLDLFAQYDVRASIYVSGLLGTTASESVRAIVESGHELCGHAWSQDLLLPTLSDADQRRDVIETTKSLRDASGSAPTGWISPRCTPTPLTPDLLAAEGYRWFGDVFDADLPYVRQTESGEIVALPFGLEINDLPMLVRYGASPRELAERFGFLVDGARREREKTYIDVTVHAHVAARAAGRAALREILDASATAGYWVATRGEIADAHLT